MNIHAFISLFIGFISFYYLFDSLKENIKAAANKLYALLLAFYGFWCFSTAILHSVYFRHLAIFWFKVSYISGVFTLTVLLIFILFLANLTFLKWFREESIILFLPVVIFTYFFLKEPVLFDLIKLKDTWFFVFNKQNIWWLVFYIYVFTCATLACIIMAISAKFEKSLRQKRMKIFILIPGIMVIIINLVFAIITFIKPPSILQNNMHITVFIFFAATKYAISKYGLMRITSKVALQNILMNINDFVILLDEKGNLIEVNEELLKILGTDKKTLLPEEIEIIISDKRTNVKEFIKKIDENKTINANVEIIASKNQRIPISIYATLLIDKFNEVNGYLIVGHDIRNLQELEIAKTERRATELSLFESVLQYKTTIDAMSDLVFLIDKNFHITLCNKAFVGFIEKFGVDKYSIIGKSIFEVLPIFGEKAKEDYERVYKTGNIAIAEDEFKIEDESFIVEIRKIPVVEVEKINKIVTIVRDITLEKKNEEHILRTSRLESLGILAGGIAHDFNNMLTGILGNINLAKNLIDPKSPIKNMLVDSEKAAFRAKELTYQLLTFSKGGEPIKKPGSIVELAKEASEFILRGSNIEVSFDIRENIFFVEFDHGQMASVFHNIILNAREALTSKSNGKIGKINIIIENYDVYEDNFFNIPKGKFVKISISDNGPGIKKEHLSKIFDPYFTTKEKGHGLGLAISFSIIKRHGGFIDVSSYEGVGTTFYIYLPAIDKLVKPKTTEEKENTPISYDILMMDDDETVRKIAKKLLTYLGCNVTFAKDGEEAILKYKKAIDNKDPFDLVILDLTVKGGLGGKETIERLLIIDKNIKAIVCSGYSNDPVLAEYKKHGFKGVVNKPFDIEDLRKEIIRVMKE